MQTTIKHVLTVKASPAAVYRAFTNATALREWLADVATVDPRPGGRFFLAWNNGYFTAGEFHAVQPDKEVQFTWAGRDDPAPSKVRVSITQLDSGQATLVLEHTNLGAGSDWSQAFKEIERGWENGLRNLVSVIDDGPDLRIINRPMMGLIFGEFDKKHAEELGIPSTSGLRIDNVVEGLGAQLAGLRKNDVIVSVDAKPLTEFTALIALLQGKQAGDRLEIGYYRGGDRKKTTLELSRRPIPEFPRTPAALSAAVEKIYAVVAEQLQALLQGVDEETAARKPRVDEWNIKEILAHLIQSERDTQAWISEIVFSAERSGDAFGGNLMARVQATASVYPTILALHEALRLAQAETVALIAALPDSFSANKGSFWRMGYQLIQFELHARDHLAQIGELLKP
jgi:uncharacterized protein YndB with AHSA1/START domain